MNSNTAHASAQSDADLSFLSDHIHLVALYEGKPSEALYFGADRIAAQIWADALNAQHYNIYWSVNVVRAGLNKKATKRDITAVRYFHCDLDDTQDEAAALYWRPTVLINSGGGFNMLWKVAGPTTVDVAEDINRRVSHQLKADHCWNIDRVLRLPGTINWPNAAKAQRGRVPVWSTLVQPDNGVAYTADNMAAAFPVVPVEARQAAGEADVGDWTPLRLDDVPMAPQLRAMCEHEAAKGERSGHVSKCCAALGYAGLNNAVVMGLLMHPDNSGLHPHIADQHNPERAARRKVALAEGVRPDAVRAFATPAVVPSYVLSEPPVPVEVTPLDLWGIFSPPELPIGLLPSELEDFARQQGELMGCNAGGLASAMLAVCAAAIPDHVQIRVKRYDQGWTEPARIWVALVGMPSTKKSPIINAASRPLSAIDARLCQEYAAAMLHYEALSKEDQKAASKPKRLRIKIEDATIEAAQEVLKDSPGGVLCLQDEMSGWFGAMDKYSGGGRGAAKDRAFWLQAFNGGAYSVDRIGRGSSFVPNLSISLLGGIQPDAIRKVAADAVDDGLLQRIFPIILPPANVGVDAPRPLSTHKYKTLIDRLHQLPATHFVFSDEAQEIRNRLEHEHLKLQAIELLNPKLAAHVGKYDGLFARLCVIWQAIEAPSVNAVSEATATRVATFLHKFFLPHAVAFFAGTLGFSKRQGDVEAVAGFILAHGKQVLSRRDVMRGDRKMRDLEAEGATKVLEQLEALGWLTEMPGPRSSSSRWTVNPRCHELFAKKGQEELARRNEAKAIITQITG